MPETTATATACPATFWAATQRRESPVASANSSDPRFASPASVDDSARIDQRPTNSAKYAA